MKTIKAMQLMLKIAEFKFKKKMAIKEFELKKQIHDDKMTIEIEKLERANNVKEDDTPTTIIFTDN